jgi:hypothetical protein
MSTAYYAYLRIPENIKRQMCEAIEADNIDEVLNIAEDVSPKVKIRIGQRSGGWKFLWNPYNEYLESLNKKSIIQFVNRDDVIIKNEYDEVQDKDEFLSMAFEWNKNNKLDSVKYMYMYPNVEKYNTVQYQKDACKKLNMFIDFKNSWQTDFYSDKLRWTIFE